MSRTRYFRPLLPPFSTCLGPGIADSYYPLSLPVFSLIFLTVYSRTVCIRFFLSCITFSLLLCTASIVSYFLDNSSKCVLYHCRKDCLNKRGSISLKQLWDGDRTQATQGILRYCVDLLYLGSFVHKWCLYFRSKSSVYKVTAVFLLSSNLNYKRKFCNPRWPPNVH